ncbi:hypothetical protein AMJ57_00595 [Parcubacteria bacterium SG8_24]|nr:MAG: hypothetical protein AMJ57_00595 [Parcubacteria bacterium SG8_24]
MKNLSFTPIVVPPALSGLDSDGLANLYDLVIKFGTDIPGVAQRRLCHPTAGSPCVRATSGKRHDIIVSRRPDGVRFEDAWVVHLLDLSGSFVAWQRGVALDEVRSLIDETDALMARNGHVHPRTRERLRVGNGEVGIRRKHAVDEVFNERGLIIPPFPGMDVEALRQMFDRPEEVATLRGTTRSGLVRRRDVFFLLWDGHPLGQTILEWSVSGRPDIRGAEDPAVRRIVRMVWDVLSGRDIED